MVDFITSAVVCMVIKYKRGLLERVIAYAMRAPLDFMTSAALGIVGMVIKYKGEVGGSRARESNSITTQILHGHPLDFMTSAVVVIVGDGD